MISISSSFIMEFACDPHAVCLSSKTGRGPKHCFWMSQIPEELISMQPPFPNEPQCKKLAYHIQKIRINFPQWVLNPYPKIQNRSSPWYYNYILSSWHSPMMSYGDGSSYLWTFLHPTNYFRVPSGSQCWLIAMGFPGSPRVTPGSAAGYVAEQTVPNVTAPWNLVSIGRDGCGTWITWMKVDGSSYLLIYG